MVDIFCTWRPRAWKSSVLAAAVVGLLPLLLINSSYIVDAHAEATLTSEVTPQGGSTEDTFSFSVTLRIDNPTANDVPSPHLVGDTDFTVQSSGTFLNSVFQPGVSTLVAAFQYTLSPRRSGKLATPAVEVTIDGKTLRAPPIEVEVTQVDPTTRPTPGPNEPIFLKSTISAPKVYQGEQILTSLFFYSRINDRGRQLFAWNPDGFWQEEVPGEQTSEKVINGFDYQVIEKRRALYPLRSGILTIPSQKVQTNVPDPLQRSFFFSTTGYRERELQSEVSTVSIIPLPSPPAQFTTALGSVPIVGATSITLDYSLDTITVGESKVVTFTVTSEGNIHPLKGLHFSPPPHIKVYEDPREVKLNGNGARLLMQRSYTYTLVPVRAGPVRIEGPRIPYFDPQSATYRWAEGPAVAFLVQDDPNAPTAPSPATGDIGDMTQQGPDTQPHNSTSPSELGYEEPGTLARLLEHVSTPTLLFLLVLAGAGGALGRILRRGTLTSKRGSLTTEEIDSAATIEGVEQLLYQLVHDLVPSLSYDNSTDEMRALTEKGVHDPHLRLRLLTLIDEVEIARYAGDDAGAAAVLERIKVRLREVVARL